MQALLVICHPVQHSLSRHLADRALTAARDAGHQVDIVDLVALGFDPRLNAGERSGYYAADADISDPIIREMATQLRQAELLILVFPTWWFGFPALLKGWFDRVWRPGIAFDHSADMGKLIPRLARLRHVVAVTTLGSPRWVDWLVLRRPLRRVLRWAIMAPCAPKARLHWLALYRAEDVTPERAERFAGKVAHTIARLTR